MSNSGFDNVKLQVLGWFSLDKKIKRAKFSFYTLPVIIALLFYIGMLAENVACFAGDIYRYKGEIDLPSLLGTLLALTILFCLSGIIVILSIRRLNDLQLPKTLSLLFCSAIFFITISGFAGDPVRRFFTCFRGVNWYYWELQTNIDIVAGVLSVLSFLLLIALCFIKGIDEAKN